MRVIDDLNRLQQALSLQTNVTLPQPTLQAYLPGTLEEQYREKGLVDILTGEALGFYAVSRVRRMWAEQHGKSENEFEEHYEPRPTYRKLHTICDEVGIFAGKSASPTGSTVQIFPLVALIECFPDVDFSSLNPE